MLTVLTGTLWYTLTELPPRAGTLAVVAPGTLFIPEVILIHEVYQFCLNCGTVMLAVPVASFVGDMFFNVDVVLYTSCLVVNISYVPPQHDFNFLKPKLRNPNILIIINETLCTRIKS